MTTNKDRLEILKGRYRLYLEAERAVLAGQSYSMEGLSLTRANLDTIRKVIADLESQILLTERRISGSRPRSRVVVPVDALNMMRFRTLCR